MFKLFIYPSGTRLGKMYGTAKVHKKNVPMRPVISMVNTATYNLAKYLHSLIFPLIKLDYSVSSSFEFYEKVKALKLNENKSYFLVSFDVESLYTNVPLKESIEIMKESVIERDLPFTIETLSKLLLLVNQSYFTFNNKIYQQTDGLAMGNPLAPLLANVFMNKIESILFETSPQNAPIEYFRYIDDTFCVFEAESHATSFLEILNKMHPNIRFTMECEKLKRLNFLDLGIEITEGKFEMVIYRKPTYTGVLLGYHSPAPKIWKINS